MTAKPNEDPMEKVEEFKEYNQTYSAEQIEQEPTSLREAKARPDWEKWEAAIMEELQQLDEMGTWTMEACPKNCKPIGCRWVFALKCDEKGCIVKYKAWLVAKGFSQAPGLDYQARFADIKGAYLNGDIE